MKWKTFMRSVRTIRVNSENYPSTLQCLTITHCLSCFIAMHFSIFDLVSLYILFVLTSQFFVFFFLLCRDSGPYACWKCNAQTWRSEIYTKFFVLRSPNLVCTLKMENAGNRIYLLFKSQRKKKNTKNYVYSDNVLFFHSLVTFFSFLVWAERWKREKYCGILMPIQSQK